MHVKGMWFNPTSYMQNYMIVLLLVCDCRVKPMHAPEGLYQLPVTVIKDESPVKVVSCSQMQTFLKFVLHFTSS